jgi:S-adenosylmethionine:tRNA ribosyltransferase-isomerase
MKARLFGVLERGNETKRDLEVLFVRPLSESAWEVLCKPGKKVRRGDRVVFSEDAIGTFGETRELGLRVLELSGASVFELMERYGHIPLPPYIERPDRESDAVEYQTIFATEPGAVAAPTAGLHFTPRILKSLGERGVEVIHITLHVGIGTFQPVREDDPSRHYLKPERFTISEEAAEKLNRARASNQRIIAVGTTSTRTLEYVVSKQGNVTAASGDADLFILPGYRFRAVEGLLTNFHLPHSTLLMLVSAFASRDVILKAYAHAVEQRYRFYSYGDCMLIL